jgi:spore coat protein CotH/photosystem II stability/assembly factor-like uncharacterized protein
MKYMILWLMSVGIAVAQIPQYNVAMAPSDYDTLFMRDPFSDDYLPCSFEFQGTTWSTAQIKFKGHSTRYYPKKSYRLKFPNSNLFQGAGQINFNAMYTDKSFIREALVWSLFEEMNFLGPRAHHARLSINGGDKGLFLFIDKIDKYFLANRGRVVAPMYEANDTYISADMTLQPDSILKLYYDKAVGSTSDYSDLTQLLTAINTASDATFADTVSKYFDVSSVLNWFTGNTLTMMGDSYTKNYFLYRDTSKPSQQWVIIPWDYDLSFGRSGDLAIPYPASLLNDNFAYTFSPLSGPYNVLKNRLLNTPSLKELFRQRVDTVLQTLFTEQRLYPRIDSLAAVVENDVALDPDKWGTHEDFLEQVEALKYYVTARKNFLNKTFINPPSGNYNDVTLQPTQLGVPYHFVGYDGRQIATLWFSNMNGLDSIRVRAYPNLIPSNIVNPGEGKYVKRWLRITPYPATATFTAKLQWMYNDASSTDREVGTGVQDERLLKCYYYDGNDFVRLASTVNAYGNFANVDSITQANCDSAMYFALLLPDSYTQMWFRQPLNYWQRWYDVKFADPQHGFVLGDQGTILRTTDAGTTWVAESIGIGLPFRSLAIPSLDNMFVAGQYGSFYHSNDTGITWSRIDLGTTNNLLGVVFPTPVKGCVYGEPRILKVTTDGGASWPLNIGIDIERTIQHVAVLNDHYRSIIAFLDSGYYFKTDLFSTYITGNTGTIGKINVAQTFASTVWAAGDSGIVLYSPDEGNSWNRIDIPLSITLRGISVIDSTTLYVAGDGGRIFYTTDNGSNWYTQYTADSHDLNAVVFTDSAHGYAVGNGGTILTTMSGGTVTDVKPMLSQIPSEYRLFQNFPNPFNPTTDIRFQISEFSNVTLKIYDVLGREIVTLLTQQLPPGSYQRPFDGAKLASGVYFYRLDVRDRSSGTLRYSHVNKMLLLK